MSSFIVSKASKKALRLRIGLTGPSGSGKTFSALQIAGGLVPWEKIALIDTENRSSEYYADFGEWNHINFEPPYTVERYIQAIHAAELAKMEAIILDSMSHAWTGTGGLQEELDKLNRTQQASGKKVDTFQNYAAITPRYEKLMNAIRLSPVHIVCCFRSKNEHAMVETGGRLQVRNMGMQPIFRPGWEYEFGQIFDIDVDHNARQTKDRSRLFAGWECQPLDATVGASMLAWAAEGVEEAEPWDGERALGLSHLLKDICEGLAKEQGDAFMERFRAAYKACQMGECRKVVAEADEMPQAAKTPA